MSVILSAAAGGNNGKREIKRQLAESFGRYGIAADIVIVRDGSDIVRHTRRALDEHEGPVVAGGGDGTVNAVASVLLEARRSLGVLPLGTLNHFARDLHIPLDLDQAVDLIVEGKAVDIDVGEVNGRIFLNNSGLGLYPAIVHNREQLQERLEYGKWPAFAWASLAVLHCYPRVKARLLVDGEYLVRHTPFIFIGNNAYTFAGLNLGTRAALNEGWLWLYTAREGGRLNLLRFTARALAGQLRNDADFDLRKAKNIRIIPGRRFIRVATDGEIQKMQTPLEYRIRPGALRVLAPAASGRTTG